jgi:hypothetical protein
MMVAAYRGHKVRWCVSVMMVAAYRGHKVRWGCVRAHVSVGVLLRCGWFLSLLLATWMQSHLHDVLPCSQHSSAFTKCVYITLVDTVLGTDGASKSTLQLLTMAPVHVAPSPA